MAVGDIFTKWLPLVSGGATAVGVLRKRLAEVRHDPSADRLSALEKTIELQAELNENIDMQLAVAQTQIAKLQRTVRALLFVVIATATVAVLALAAALRR